MARRATEAPWPNRTSRLPLIVGTRVALTGAQGEPHLGTVSRVSKDSFRITFDFEPSADHPMRRPREPRGRYTYPRSAWPRFMYPDTQAPDTAITPDSEA